MRILICSDHYPPFIGGAHRWAELIARGLSERGHQVAVVTTWHPGLPEHEIVGLVAVNRIRQVRTAVDALAREPGQRHMPPFPDPVSRAGMRTVTARFAPDVAIVHGWIGASVIPVLTKRGVPVLLSGHDYGYFCATRTYRNGDATCTGPGALKCARCATAFYGSRTKGVACVAGVAASKRLTTSRVAGIHTVSSFVDRVTWEHVGQNLSSSVKRFVIHEFIDEEPVDPDADDEQVRHVVSRLPQEPFIMFAGALREIKGVYVLLDAYRRLPNPPPLVLMGTTHPDTPKQLPAGVIQINDAPHPAVMAGWRRAIVGVVPSVWPDPCPTVAIECASQGTPVIGTVPGGMSDTIGDGGGILVPMGDPEALARALTAVIEDTVLRAKLQTEAKMAAARFTGERALTAYERALSGLIGAGS